MNRPPDVSIDTNADPSQYGASVLSPMLVQYLVGLCCLRRNPAAVDVVLGDMVLDTAADKERDVDVTITMRDKDDTISAFKAYEVKREGTPLDVSQIEQLCLKFMDMPSVTYRAIVSTSGFTSGAQKKAAYHRVELYKVEPWIGDLEVEFPNWELNGPVEKRFLFGKTLLVWSRWRLDLVAPTGPSSFECTTDDPILTASGEPHPAYTTIQDYQQALLMRSTEVLFRMAQPHQVLQMFPLKVGDQDVALSPEWPHTHTLDVTRDDVHLEKAGRLTKLENVSISGELQWQSFQVKPEYHIMRRVPDGEVFAGAMVGEGTREGQLVCFVLDPTSETAGVHLVQLEEKHKNIIRRLHLDLPPPVQGE